MTATVQLDLAGVPGARRLPCRVCKGSQKMPSNLLRGAFEPCAFCVDGVARVTCEACGEALPLCACFGEYRRAAAPPTPFPSFPGGRR